MHCTKFSSNFVSPSPSAPHQKLLEIEKEIVREVARGDKYYLRESANRKAMRLLRCQNAT